MKNRLIYVMGASGSGKDSLMRYARVKLASHPGIVFAHRYITRSADAGGENHVSLSPEEFTSRIASGFFALHWESHNHQYGIGIEINQWMARGATVIVNGSREYYSNVVKIYHDVVPLLIAVSPNVLRERLLQRGRETPEQIEMRLKRHRDLTNVYGEILTLDNNGPLRASGQQLVDLIRHYTEGDCQPTKLSPFS